MPVRLPSTTGNVEADLHLDLAPLGLTMLVPFPELPPCAQHCGTLYDANDSCVPPTVPVVDDGGATYRACFCAYPALQPWRDGAGADDEPDGLLLLPCAVACRDDPAGLASLRGWYTRFCAETVSGTPVVTQTRSENRVGAGSLVPNERSVGSGFDSGTESTATAANIISPNETDSATTGLAGTCRLHPMLRSLWVDLFRQSGN